MDNPLHCIIKAHPKLTGDGFCTKMYFIHICISIININQTETPSPSKYLY